MCGNPYEEPSSLGGSTPSPHQFRGDWDSGQVSYGGGDQDSQNPQGYSWDNQQNDVNTNMQPSPCMYINTHNITHICVYPLTNVIRNISTCSCIVNIYECMCVCNYTISS